MLAPLIVEYPAMGKFALDYVATGTQDKIKRRIQDRFGIPPDNFCIWFKDSELDGTPIPHLGIKPGMTINMDCVGGKCPVALDTAPLLIPITVMTPTGEAMEFTVLPSESMYSIKVRVCQIKGFPVKQQCFFVGAEQLEDHDLVAAHMLDNKPLLVMVVVKEYIQIYVQTESGKTFMVNVPNDATMDDVKAKMGALLDLKDPYDCQIFSRFWGGRVFEGKQWSHASETPPLNFRAQTNRAGAAQHRMSHRSISRRLSVQSTLGSEAIGLFWGSLCHCRSTAVRCGCALSSLCTVAHTVA
jgi:hypothetical protein